MNTPPPILSIPDTTEPPSGQHGPDSGLSHHEGHTEAAQAPSAPLDGLAALGYIAKPWSAQ